MPPKSYAMRHAPKFSTSWSAAPPSTPHASPQAGPRIQAAPRPHPSTPRRRGGVPSAGIHGAMVLTVVAGGLALVCALSVIHAVYVCVNYMYMYEASGHQQFWPSKQPSKQRTGNCIWALYDIAYHLCIVQGGVSIRLYAPLPVRRLVRSMQNLVTH